MDETATRVAAENPAPGPGALFAGFLILGLTGFGGVLPMARHMLVERRRWLTAEGFTDLLGLCQFLPGGNVINLSVAVGMRFRGPLGAFVCLAGLLIAPAVIVILIGLVYARFEDHPIVRHAFAGLAAAAAGLLVALSVKLLLPLRGRVLHLMIALACFLAVATLRLPLLPALAVLVPGSILLVHLAGKRSEAGA